MLPLLFLGAFVACERRPVSTSTARDHSPALVKINGKTLTRKDFDVFLPEEYQGVLTTEEKREYLNRWITTHLLYEEAIRQKLGDNADVKARLEQYKKDLIADQLVQNIIQQGAVVSEPEIRAYYQTHEDEFGKEYRVSHILVNTPEDAETVRELLGKYSFSYLARRYSADRHSGPGGDLGFLSKGNMIPEFENVLFNMNVGDISEPIESEFGYHIITLTDIRNARVKLEYEDVKGEIANILTMKKRAAVYDSLVTALRSSAQIEIMHDALGLTVETYPDTLPASP